MLVANRGCIILTARSCQISPTSLNQIDGAEVWATSVLLAYPKSAEVDFTEASWSPTQLAEVDATAVPKKSGYLLAVCQPEAACADQEAVFSWQTSRRRESLVRAPIPQRLSRQVSWKVL